MKMNQMQIFEAIVHGTMRHCIHIGIVVKSCNFVVLHIVKFENNIFVNSFILLPQVYVL